MQILGSKTHYVVASVSNSLSFRILKYYLKLVSLIWEVPMQETPFHEVGQGVTVHQLLRAFANIYIVFPLFNQSKCRQCLVIYWSITNHPKNRGLKHQQFIIIVCNDSMVRLGGSSVLDGLNWSAGIVKRSKIASVVQIKGWCMLLTGSSVGADSKETFRFI